jgi:hypothetical protein
MDAMIISDVFINLYVHPYFKKNEYVHSYFLNLNLFDTSFV